MYQIITSLNDKISVHFDFKVSTRLPIVSTWLLWRKDHIAQPYALRGLSALTAEMVTQGSAHKPYAKFMEELEVMSSSLSAFATHDVFGFRMECLSENFKHTWSLLTECALHPRFATEDWNRVQRDTLEALHLQKDQPHPKLSRMSGDLLFGPQHPYAWPTMGDEESVKNMTLEDIKSHWQDLIQNCEKFVFSAVGDFDPDSFVVSGTDFLKSLNQNAQKNKQKTPLYTVFPTPHPPQDNVRFQVLQRNQTHIRLDVLSLPITHPDHLALSLAARILSGSGGRLYLDLREEKSLAYSLTAWQNSLLNSGFFSAYIATSFEKTQEAFEGLAGHMRRLFSSHPPTQDEVSQAQKSLAGSCAIEHQHYGYQAKQMGLYDIYGLGYDHFSTFLERLYAIDHKRLSVFLQSTFEKSRISVSLVGPENIWRPAQDNPLLNGLA